MSKWTNKQTAQRQEPEAETLDQSSLPLPMRYRKDEELVKAEMAFGALLDQAIRKTNTASHLQPKQIQADVNLPLFTYLAQWIANIHTDVIAYVQTQLLNQEGGLDDNTADTIIATIEELYDAHATLNDVLAATAGETTLDVLRPKLQQVLAQIADGMSALSELVGEEEEEEEEEEPDEFDPDEPDGDDEPEDEPEEPADVPPLDIR